MSKIAILGCGRLGTRIAEECIKTNLFDELSLLSRSSNWLEGSIKSLKVWAYLKEYDTDITKFVWSNKNEYDIILLAIKENYDLRNIKTSDYLYGFPKDLRYAGLSKDLKNIYKTLHKLRGYKGSLVITSNPVDLLTAYFGRHLSNCTVLGLGLGLDSARISYQLSTFINNISYSKFSSNQLLLVGPHGPEAKPVFASSDWQTICRNVPDDVLNNAIKNGLKMGYDIVNDLGFTLHDCGIVFKDDIKWLISKNEEEGMRCMSIAIDRTSTGGPLKWSGDKNLSLTDLPTHLENTVIYEMRQRIFEECDLLEKYIKSTKKQSD